MRKKRVQDNSRWQLQLVDRPLIPPNLTMVKEDKETLLSFYSQIQNENLNPSLIIPFQYSKQAALRSPLNLKWCQSVPNSPSVWWPEDGTDFIKKNTIIACIHRLHIAHEMTTLADFEFGGEMDGGASSLQTDSRQSRMSMLMTSHFLFPRHPPLFLIVLINFDLHFWSPYYLFLSCSHPTTLGHHHQLPPQPIWSHPGLVSMATQHVIATVILSILTAFISMAIMIGYLLVLAVEIKSTIVKWVMACLGWLLILWLLTASALVFSIVRLRSQTRWSNGQSDRHSSLWGWLWPRNSEPQFTGTIEV